MTDFYNEMLQKSIDRQAREITAKGITEQDRYGNLLNTVKGRDLKQEETDRKNAMVSNLANSIAVMREKRTQESREHSEGLQRIMNDVKTREMTREKRQLDDFLSRNKDYLEKGREAVRRQQSKMYFD